MLAEVLRDQGYSSYRTAGRLCRAHGTRAPKGPGHRDRYGRDTIGADRSRAAVQPVQVLIGGSSCRNVTIEVAKRRWAQYARRSNEIRSEIKVWNMLWTRQSSAEVSGA